MASPRASRTSSDLWRKGIPIQAIADTLFIGITTVKSHIRSILRKLGLHCRATIAVWAHQPGFD